MIYFIGIANAATNLFRTIMFLISTSALRLVIYLYDIFIRLGRAEFLTSSQVQAIYSRIELVLGIFMLFKLTFSFIQMLLNPDLMSDKSKGASKIIMKCVVVVALLGTVPFIFQQAYKLQNFILESNALGKIVTGYDYDGEINNFGAILAENIFLSFYSVREGETCEAVGENYVDLIDEIRYNHTFNLAGECLDKNDTWFSYGEYIIDFEGHGIVLVAVSIFILYIILSYCLEVGKRVVQLAFLQLIAPIPIMSYLGEDKEGAFQKWIKRCISTFLSLFIRLVIIYFVVYIINLLLSDSDSYYLLLSSTGNPTGITSVLIKVVLILGLLMFAKKAPELLKEVLPAGIGGEDYGFSLKKTRENLAPLSRAVGFGTGALASAGVSGIARFNANRRSGNNLRKSLLGAAGGVVTGFGTGAMNGAKKGNMFKNVAAGVKSRRTADNKYNELITDGGTTFGAIRSKVVDTFGETRGQRESRQINDIQQLVQYKKEMNDAINEINEVKVAKQAYESFTNDGTMSIAEFTAKKNELYANYKKIRNAVSTAAIDAVNTGSFAKQNIQYEYTYTDASGVEKTVKNTINVDFADADNRAYASTAKAAIDKANDAIKNKNIQYYNTTTNSFETVDKIKDAAEMRNVETLANQTVSHIHSSEGYSKNLAEDKYFGVDSNASSKK